MRSGFAVSSYPGSANRVPSPGADLPALVGIQWSRGWRRWLSRRCRSANRRAKLRAVVPRPTVLFVDDDLEDLKLISQTFERHLNVVTASSGPEALVVLEEQQIDLLVTDQRMPGMSGIELVQAARASGIDIPTILVTAYTDPRDGIDAINKGEAYRFITNPWSPDD